MQSSYYTFLVGITAVHVSVFHKRYIKQFIWKRAETRVNLDEQNSNEEESNGTPTDQNVKKSYLERVCSAFVFGIRIILLALRHHSST